MQQAIKHMQRVRYLSEQLRSFREDLSDMELPATAIQGLPKSCHGVAQSFDIRAVEDVTSDKVKHTLKREEERLKQDDTNEVACEARVRTSELLQTTATGQLQTFVT